MSDPLAAARRHLEFRQEVAAHNLANVDTAGFKGERVFARVLGAAGAASAASDAPALPVSDAATDLRQGPLRDTGAPFDFALSGPGFFVVATPQGERWTRGGSFTPDAAGVVRDATGAALLGEAGPVTGPVTVPPGARQVSVDPAGRVLLSRPPAGYFPGGHRRPVRLGIRPDTAGRCPACAEQRADSDRGTRRAPSGRRRRRAPRLPRTESDEGRPS